MPACEAVSQNRRFIKLTVFSLLNVLGKLFIQSIRVRSIFVLTNINGIPKNYFYPLPVYGSCKREVSCIINVIYNVIQDFLEKFSMSLDEDSPR